MLVLSCGNYQVTQVRQNTNGRAINRSHPISMLNHGVPVWDSKQDKRALYNTRTVCNDHFALHKRSRWLFSNPCIPGLRVCPSTTVQVRRLQNVGTSWKQNIFGLTIVTPFFKQIAQYDGIWSRWAQRRETICLCTSPHQLTILMVRRHRCSIQCHCFRWCLYTTHTTVPLVP